MSEIFLYASRAVMPLLLMILLGYLLRLGNFWDDSFFRQLNRFCFRVFLPVQLFLNVYSVGSLSELNWVLLVYIIGGILFSMALGILVAHLTAKRRAQRAVIAQATFRSNQVILGVPLASALGGASAMAFASLVTSVCVPVFNVLAVLVLTMYASGSPGAAGWKTRLMNIAKNPLILGACTGLVVVAIRGLLPTGADGTPVFTLQSSLPSLFSVLQQFSKVATPIMLVVLGTQIRFDAVWGLLKNLTVAACMRLIVVHHSGACRRSARAAGSDDGGDAVARGDFLFAGGRDERRDGAGDRRRRAARGADRRVELGALDVDDFRVYGGSAHARAAVREYG